ncbi:gephyrin-like molybdotransferase Glp [Thioclava pacifica]|uniref:molybdopterin molybdotransferase MoeA n=1 Tax=Thioclava pacifica TaxID=285109 RepID=UPI00056DAD80|nr:gephyrin-like molybdotransferase Glp [Thioclava pacifica]
MLPVEDALEKVLALVEPLGTEVVPLRAAVGRVMAEPASARLTQPPFSASAMDGYWLDVADHLPGAKLTVEGEAAAGRAYAGTPTPGQAVRIFTGAPVPGPNGVVVLQENVTREGDTITLPQELETHNNIRPEGQDFAQGESFGPERPLTARDLGLLAAMNVSEVTVRRRPVVAIIATGDELVMPGEEPGPDQIICSNSFIIAALAERMGAEARMLPIARDDRDSLRTVFELAKGADLVVTSGGASVGAHDLVGDVAEELGLERRFWKIAMRPGKPLMAGRMGGAAMLGLPGNPVSATVCAELFLRPMLRKLAGLPPESRVQQAQLAVDTGPTGPRTHYMRARLKPGNPLPRVTPFDNQDSAMLSILSQADCLLIRPIGDGPRKAGETVDILPLD